MEIVFTPPVPGGAETGDQTSVVSTKPQAGKNVVAQAGAVVSAVTSVENVQVPIRAPGTLESDENPPCPSRGSLAMLGWMIALKTLYVASAAARDSKVPGVASIFAARTRR